MKLIERITEMKNFWNKLPDQVKRLSVLIIALAALFILIRPLFIPDDFGEYGHYRASAAEENAYLELKYAGQEICFDCHDDTEETKNAGYHRNLACEICHGPGKAHAEEPESVLLAAPRERGFCPLCHEYLPSRPTGFPQIVTASHNPMMPCIQCHDPHDPEPPEVPKECDACHAAIARSKALSHHVNIPCTFCHKTPEEHKINPREILPAKPVSREFCAQCHGENISNKRGIPKVDIATHEPRYVCWQCHYPHLPEAK